MASIPNGKKFDNQLPLPRREIVEPNLSRPNWAAPSDSPHGVLCLDRNENVDPKMIAVVDGLLRKMPPDIVSHYPATGRLYIKLAKYLNLPAEMLFLSAGSDGAIRSVFETYVESGDAIENYDAHTKLL